jgi:hypothetical protein
MPSDRRFRYRVYIFVPFAVLVIKSPKWFVSGLILRFPTSTQTRFYINHLWSARFMTNRKFFCGSPRRNSLSKRALFAAVAPSSSVCGRSASAISRRLYTTIESRLNFSSYKTGSTIPVPVLVRLRTLFSYVVGVFQRSVCIAIDIRWVVRFFSVHYRQVRSLLVQ